MYAHTHGSVAKVGTRLAVAARAGNWSVWKMHAEGMASLRAPQDA